jgi:hypothetical protein
MTSFFASTSHPPSPEPITGPYLEQSEPVHALPPNSFKIPLNVILYLHLGLSSCIFCLVFVTTFLSISQF